MTILKPDPVYSFRITLQKVAFNILVCYVLIGFLLAWDLFSHFLDYTGYISLAIVPLISGATIALTNILKQSLRKD